jgi:hypothetical protein
MSKLEVGRKVQIISSIPEFYQRKGTISAITKPFVADEKSREDALRELRLYDVRLDDGRHFRFRGKELMAHEQTAAGTR